MRRAVARGRWLNRDVAQRHWARRFAEGLQQAQAAVEAFDKIGGALLAALTLQLWHWLICPCGVQKMGLARNSRHGIIRPFVQ